MFEADEGMVTRQELRCSLQGLYFVTFDVDFYEIDLSQIEVVKPVGRYDFSLSGTRADSVLATIVWMKFDLRRSAMIRNGDAMASNVFGAVHGPEPPN